MMRPALLLSALATLWLPAAALAQQPEQAGDPARGHQVAQQACADCHQIGNGEGKQQANAPSFQEIAKGADKNNLELIGALESGKHPKISQPLQRQQMRDVVAYIRQLTTGDKR
jgi:mono/diheme cytochrome c family protein